MTLPPGAAPATAARRCAGLGRRVADALPRRQPTQRRPERPAGQRALESDVSDGAGAVWGRRSGDSALTSSHRGKLCQRRKRSMFWLTWAKTASSVLAGWLVNGECPQVGQALKCSPGISTSLRGATVLDQLQTGQVKVRGEGRIGISKNSNGMENSLKTFSRNLRLALRFLSSMARKI